MTPVSTPSLPPRRHPRLFAVSVRVLVVVSVLLVAAGSVLVYRLATATTSALQAAPFPTPAVRSVTLTPGTWVLYERTGTTSQVGPLTSTVNGPVRMQASDVSVTGSDGAVAVEDLDANENITEDGEIYTGAVAFHVTRAGSYHLTVSGRLGDVRLGPDLGDALGASAGWFVAVGLCLLGVVVSGAVALATRRRVAVVGLAPTAGLVPGFVPGSAAGLAPGFAPGFVRAGTAPPGWYPDPRGTGGMLWWDGALWRVPRSPGSPPDGDAHPVGPPL